MAFHDGFGTRHFAGEERAGAVETLQLTPALATGDSERVIRERVARGFPAWSSGIGPKPKASPVVPVGAIERDGAGLRLVSQLPPGVRLTRLMAALESGDLRLPPAARLELVAALVRAVAQLHARPGAGAHGAIAPQHVVVTIDGTVRLTHGVLGAAIERLQLSRDQLWRGFRLAMPAAAGLPRLDQRADVPQLAGVAAAILMARRLREDEYPRGIAAVVTEATANLAASATYRSGLRTWLEHSLQLHPRAIFGSAVDAEASLHELLALSASRRAAQLMLQGVIRQLLGDQPPPRAAAVDPLSPRLFVPPSASVSPLRLVVGA